MLHCSYVVKYWRGKLLANLANGSQFAKILPNQSLPLKYFEHRGEVISQFITTKSLVSIHLPIDFNTPVFCHVVWYVCILQICVIMIIYV